MAVGFNYYIYYRVSADGAGAQREKVARLLHLIAKQTGVRGRHLQSVEDPLTWMEVYEGVIDPLGFEGSLATEVARLGLTEGLAEDSRRHVERFVSCA